MSSCVCVCIYVLGRPRPMASKRTHTINITLINQADVARFISTLFFYILGEIFETSSNINILFTVHAYKVTFRLCMTSHLWRE